MASMDEFYFPTHAHSMYSWLDAMNTPQQMVETVASYGQPGITLTDHGVMSGGFELYTAAKKAGIKPFIGSEFYLVEDLESDLKKERYHIIITALNYQGYLALVKLSSQSWTEENFYKKPLISFENLELLSISNGLDVMVTTGCYFGYVQQALVNHGPNAAYFALDRLRTLFPQTLFVELQNHQIEHETDAGRTYTDSAIVRWLHQAAIKRGLPTVIGQDSHYCHSHQKESHDLMKRICYFGDSDDYVFPGDSFHLAETRWMKKHYPQKVWERAMEGHSAILAAHNLTIPALDEYALRLPSVTSDPVKKLRRMVARGLKKRGVTVDTYAKQAKRELAVMEAKGFSEYFIIAEDFASFCRMNGIFMNVRGSANASVVCWALEISDVDPIEYDLDFDRFLSMYRAKPPDIDFDVSSSRRGECIEYLKKIHEGAVQLTTFGRLGITTDPITGEQRGSVYVQYQAAMRRKKAQRGWTAGEVLPEDVEPLDRLGEQEAYKNFGVHAGAVILPCADGTITDITPRMRVISSNTTVTQIPMDPMEDAGAVKFDVLGLSQLDVVGRILELLGKSLSRDGMSWIPLDDVKTFRHVANGEPTGIFQFEGWSTAKGSKRMKPTTVKEMAICLSIFRPAMMNSGQTDAYLQNKRDGLTTTYFPAADEILDWSYGVPVFQEQVIRLLRLSELTEDDINKLLKAVKASNSNIHGAGQVFDSIEKKFVTGLVNRQGITKRSAQEIWELVTQFREYGFNKAHATSYGLLAYRCAWLKMNHPTEFILALLQSWANTDKEKIYRAEAKRMGFKIGSPTVNTPDGNWVAEEVGKHVILRPGIASIKGVGPKAVEALTDEFKRGGPYTSIANMIERLPGRPVTGGKNFEKTGELVGVYKALEGARALPKQS